MAGRRILFVIFAACYTQPAPPAPPAPPPAPPARHWVIAKSDDKCIAAEICDGRSACDSSPHDYPCPQSPTIVGPLNIVSAGDHCVVDIVCPPGAVGYQNCPWQLPCP
jgi:hypothetical protein